MEKMKRTEPCKFGTNSYSLKNGINQIQYKLIN